MALVIEPQNVHLEKAVIGSRGLSLSERYIGATGSDRSKGVIYCSGMKGFERSGTFGDPTMASKDEGEKDLAAIINDLADIMVQVVQLEKRGDVESGLLASEGVWKGGRQQWREG